MKFRYTIIIILLLTFLAGCRGGNSLAQSQPSVSTPEGTEVVLDILVEKSLDGYESRVGLVLEMLMENYTAEHPNVTFEIEYLPDQSDLELRELRIEQLRYEILAGKGPDIYFISDGTIGEPLFQDIDVVMRNGVFHDVSAYYNSDKDLHTEELNQTVMNSGTYGEARYVLPLSYDMMVLQVNDAVLGDYGLDKGMLTADISSFLDTIWEAADRTGELRLSECAGDERLIYLERFGQILDYDNGEVLLTAQELADWMRSEMEREERAYALRDEGAVTFEHINTPSFDDTLWFGYIWYGTGAPAYLSGVHSALTSTIAAKAEGKEISIYPLRASDGNLCVDVTCWAAVGSGCDYADVAYDFLRGFLTQDVQWDKVRDSRSATKNYPTLCWNGLPVRTTGSTEPLMERMFDFIESRKHAHRDADEDEFLARREAFLRVQLTDKDFPIVDAKIDYVRFGSIHDMNIQVLMEDWFDNFTGKAKDVDYEKEAADFVRDLEFFLAES